MTTASVLWLLGSTTQIFLQRLTFYFPISSESWPGNDLSRSSFPGLFILQSLSFNSKPFHSQISENHRGRSQDICETSLGVYPSNSLKY